MQEGYTLEGVLDYDHFGHTLGYFFWDVWCLLGRFFFSVVFEPENRWTILQPTKTDAAYIFPWNDSTIRNCLGLYIVTDRHLTRN